MRHICPGAEQWEIEWSRSWLVISGQLVSAQCTLVTGQFNRVICKRPRRPAKSFIYGLPYDISHTHLFSVPPPRSCLTLCTARHWVLAWASVVHTATCHVPKTQPLWKERTVLVINLLWGKISKAIPLHILINDNLLALTMNQETGSTHLLHECAQGRTHGGGG